MPATSGPLAQALVDIEAEFHVNANQLVVIRDAFSRAIALGLSDDGDAAGNEQSGDAALPMLPSHIVSRPTGDHLQDSLALDLGGTNLRVCHVRFAPRRVPSGPGSGSDRNSTTFTMRQHRAHIPESLKTGDGADLFDFIADELAQFLEQENLLLSNPAAVPLFPLGFTFSFPMIQTSINAGVLKHWTKGFTSLGVEGKDVGFMLQHALHKRHPRLRSVRVDAIVNDTVGTMLAAAAVVDTRATIGVIFGTGTNAAYYEKMEKIVKCAGQYAPETGVTEMALNVEWGGFDPNLAYLPVTKFDRTLDRMSLNPHQQHFEKMISGMYLGEIVRLTLLDLLDRGLLLRESILGLDSALTRAYGIDTADISHCLDDASEELDDVARLMTTWANLQHEATAGISLEQRQAVVRLCAAVRTRAALLGGAGLAALLRQRDDLLAKGCVVGLDGSVYEHLSGFKDTMVDALKTLIGEDAAKRVELVNAHDGSGLGAAVAAAISRID